MKIWEVKVSADASSPKKDGMARSEKEARAKAIELGGEKSTGWARLIDVATDKDGVIALYQRKDYVKETEKAFDITDGRWKERVGNLKVD